MTQVIEVVMLLIMVGSLVGAMINRWQLRRGIGGRTIQFVGLSWILGITVILALEGKLSEGVAGTLLGAIAGYLFGKWPTKPDRRNSGHTGQQDAG